MRTNLIIVRAGDNSLHPEWVRPGKERHFDLFVSYFGSDAGRFQHGADHYHAMAGPRWPAHHAICRDQWDLLQRYDHVAFVCDDVRADAETWNRLFSICREHRLDIAQPAIDGFASHDITRPQDGCLLRFTNFVEIMCPVFSRQALTTVSWTFAESVSGWGLDMLWPQLLSNPPYRLAIVDAVRVTHTRPVLQGPLQQALLDRGIIAREEFRQFKVKFGLPNQPPRRWIKETGRVMIATEID